MINCKGRAGVINCRVAVPRCGSEFPSLLGDRIVLKNVNATVALDRRYLDDQRKQEGQIFFGLKIGSKESKLSRLPIRDKNVGTQIKVTN